MPKGSDQIGPLKGVDEDVKYDSAAASALSAACRSAATTIDGQAAGRSSWVQSALEEFQGYYSTLFTNNASVAAADAINLSESLRSVATEVDKLTAAAQAEQKRRETARAWKKQHDGKNWWEKTWDSIFGEDPPPVGPAAVPVTSSVAAPAQGTRTPLTGSGSTGTSSADPGDLDLFATNSQTANDSLRSLPGSLTTKYNTFTAGCHWGGVEASGVFSAFGTYLSHNDNDVSWARAVASAFSRAGSEGGAATLPNAAITAALQSAGVTSSRDPIAVDPPTAQGGKVTSGYSDDPVNAATGNFVEPEVDLGFDGGCASLVWTRMYNSVAFERGAFGPGWASIADSRLIVDGESARWVQADGRHVVFPRQGEGWDRADGESLWLTADPGSADGGFVVRDNDGGCWTFCGSGRPATESRGAGTELSYRWAGDRLVAVVHERGRRLDLSWDGDRIAAVKASDGRRVVYGYDDKGRLSTESVDGHVVRRYGWDDADRIATVTDADGVRLVDNVYDEAGRVVWQTSPHGRRSHYTYLPGRATVVADADGGRSNTWIHDGRGRLVGIVDDEGRRQSASWDGYGNQVLVTERDGATTVRAFDERGRLVTEQVPSGARIQTGYDDLDRVVRVDVASEPGTVATTRYEYAGEDRNPSLIRDPEGGVTRVVWRHGLPVEVTDPTGVVVAMDYDERGDLVAVQDAAGSTARLERDATGRVVAAVTPLGHRTVYGYDEAGLCDRRVDPDGAVWRFEYTAAGRLLATVDPLGGRVETSYDDAGEEAATVDEIGRTIRRRTDDLGNLASVELPDGSRWEFGHDAASQLTGFTDGGGGRWEMSWDPAGRLSATRDATGVERRIERDPATGLPTTLVDGADRVGARYDRLGRVVAETGPDGAERTCRYDLCGRLVEAMDAQGQVTRIAYDAAGRVLGVTQPSGRRWGYEYDRCGRRSATISTGGRRYEFVHDADGRIAAEVWPTGERVETRFDVCGRPVFRREPGVGESKVDYDRLGRVVRSDTPQFGTRRFSYDAAGQLVAATDALGRVTRFEWDGTGRLAAIVDPLGNTTRRRYDPMGQLIGETDPLGRTTTFAYDAAGRPIARVDPAGSRIQWRYDAAKLLTSEWADGRELSRFDRDFAGRSLQITEPAPGGGQTVHRLDWDVEGRLVRRRRDGRGLGWSYDADGHRIGLDRPEAGASEYGYDAEGYLTAVQVDGLGAAEIAHDEIGRVTRLSADAIEVSWTWRDGFIAAQQVTREGSTRTTTLTRDDHGRVIAAQCDGATTRYEYDAAGQLTGLRGSDGRVTGFEYDAAGRLIRETVDGASTRYEYDAAGQLTAMRGPDGVTRFGYDGAGRRVRQMSPDGSERLFDWDPRGSLASVTEIGRDGDRLWAHRLDVDALGELAAVDGTRLWWDTAADLPELVQVDGTGVEQAGVLTGVGRVGWREPGWGARPVPDADPWAASEAVDVGQDGALSVAGGGQLGLAGLEIMGARVYDPATRGFLSPDPLDGVAGAAWAGARYGFAGNDPVGAADPLGLAPVTADQLKHYADQHRGGLSTAWHAAGSWWKKNWQYVAAGAVVAAGVVLIATGVGAGVGAGILIGAATSGAFSAGSQYVTTGHVDWRRTALDTAIGGVAGAAGGGAGAAVAGATERSAVSCLGRNVLVGAADGAANGGVTNGLDYLSGPGPHSVGGFAAATGSGVVDGGGAGAAGGAFAKLTHTSSIACFVAGTRVRTAGGGSRPIEDVGVGDRVEAWNAETGEYESREVVETFVHEGVETWRVVTDGGRVVSTAEHPFRVAGRGWVRVRDLRAGDVLEGSGGGATVESVEATGGTATVYNLHVEGLHTYQVATDDGAWVTVHNECGGEDDAAAVVRAKVEEMRANMDEGEPRWTTYGAAHVTLPSGENQVWVSQAGRRGYVRPGIRGDAIAVKSPILEGDIPPHINDAEMHLSRAAREQNATINAIGATRPVCHWCQRRLPGAPFVTPLKE